METTTSNKCRDCKWYEIEKEHGSRSSGDCINPDRIAHNLKFGRADYIMKRCGSSTICKNFKKKEEEEDSMKQINKFNIGDTVYIPAKITGIELKKFKANGEEREYIVYKIDKRFNILKEDKNCLGPADPFYRNSDRYKSIDTWTENMLVEAAIDNG